MKIVDIHCHTFNAMDVPIASFGWMVQSQLPRLWRCFKGAIDALTEPDPEAKFAREDADLRAWLEELSEGAGAAPPDSSPPEDAITAEELLRDVQDAIAAVAAADTIQRSVSGVSAATAARSAAAWLDGTDAELRALSSAVFKEMSAAVKGEHAALLPASVSSSDGWSISGDVSLETDLIVQIEELQEKSWTRTRARLSQLSHQLGAIEQLAATPEGAEQLLETIAGPELRHVLDHELPPPPPGTLRVHQLSSLLGRVRAFLKLVRLSRHRMTHRLVSDYPGVYLLTPALVDFDLWVPGSDAALPVKAQLRLQDRIARCAALGGYQGTHIHPLVPFNPLKEVLSWREQAGADFDPDRPEDFDPFGMGRREDGYVDFDNSALLPPLPGPFHARALPITAASPLMLVRRAIEQGGFVGVKIYPPNGFAPLENHNVMMMHDPAEDNYPFQGMRRAASEHGLPRLADWIDQAMAALYSYCEAMGVPILTHANHSNGFGPGFRELVAPERWDPVLAGWPGLRLCFGHFGHMHASGDSLAETWAGRFADRMQGGVVGDVSNSKMVSSNVYRRKFVAFLKDLLWARPALGRQLMYGSDWYMNNFRRRHRAFPERIYGAIEEVTAGLPDAEEIRADFMHNNALRWLGLLDADNNPTDPDVPGNRQRLLRWYDGAELPEWLA